MNDKKIRRMKKRAKNSGVAWSAAHVRYEQAVELRDDKLWECLERTVRYLKAAKLRSKKAATSAIAEFAAHLDSRARWRYARIVWQAARELGPLRLRHWVSTKGGISHFK
jgi:hypothetical protein